MKRTSILLRTAAAALLALAPAASARAGIVFETGNHPQPGEENVLLTRGSTGPPIFGVTNQSGLPVEFTSSQSLFVPSNGQARIEAGTPAAPVGLTDITITAPKGTYQDIILNPFLNGGQGPGAPGDATVTVLTNDGTFQFTYALANGNNFLTVFTTGGESILSTNVSAANGFTDLRQPRISGIASVPEPSTLTLAGFAGLGGLAYAWRRRRGRAR